MCARVGRRYALNRADTSRRMMRFLATRLIYLVGASIVVLTLNAVDASEKFSSEIAETKGMSMVEVGDMLRDAADTARAERDARGEKNNRPPRPRPEANE